MIANAYDFREENATNFPISIKSSVAIFIDHSRSRVWSLELGLPTVGRLETSVPVSRRVLAHGILTSKPSMYVLDVSARVAHSEYHTMR